MLEILYLELRGWELERETQPVNASQLPALTFSRRIRERIAFVLRQLATRIDQPDVGLTNATTRTAYSSR
jgi:hypothetical protein